MAGLAESTAPAGAASAETPGIGPKAIAKSVSADSSDRVPSGSSFRISSCQAVRGGMLALGMSLAGGLVGGGSVLDDMGAADWL